MSDPAEDVPTDRQFRESNRDFELGALRLGMTRAVGIRTVVELTDQLHRSIQGMEVAIPMIADVHHASTDRTVTVKDVEFQQSEIRVRRPSVSHLAYLRDHEPSVDSQNQLGCYVSKSRNSSRLADHCSFSCRLRARLLEHRIKGVPELVAQMRPATHEETGDHASSVDDDGLRNGIGRVLLGNGPITVECDRRVQLVPLEHGGDLPGRFLQVDRDQLYVPISKLAGDPLDLRHRLQARSTPGGPEIENDHLPPGLRQMELRPSQQLQLEVGSRLAHEGGFGAQWTTARRWAGIGLKRFRLSRVLQFPLLIDQTFRGLVDDAADQQLTDFLENDLARTQHVALARERLAGKLVGQEGQAYSIIANGLDSRGRAGRRRRRGFAGGTKLIRMQPDDQGKPVAGDFLGFQADFN